jgi:methionine-rich copper-binding protein CopC
MARGTSVDLPQPFLPEISRALKISDEPVRIGASIHTARSAKLKPERNPDMVSRFLKSPGTIAVFLCAFFVAVPAALAHSNLIAATASPAADATIDPPDHIVLHFTGDLEPKFSSIQLMDATGHVVNKEASVVDSTDKKLMTLALPKLYGGIYTVSWVAVSIDTHRTSGEYKFTANGPPAPVVPNAHSH